MTRPDFLKALHAEDPVAAVETFLDRALRQSPEELADTIRQVGVAMREKLGESSGKYFPGSPLPSDADIWFRFKRFATACKACHSHGKRRLLFNATLNSMDLCYQDNEMDAILWPKLEALPYKALVLLWSLVKEDAEEDRFPMQLPPKESVWSQHPEVLVIGRKSGEAEIARLLEAQNLIEIAPLDKEGAGQHQLCLVVTGFAGEMGGFAFWDFLQKKGTKIELPSFSSVPDKDKPRYRRLYPETRLGPE
jgi:hypothetical protein